MADEFTILDNGETLITGEWMPPPEDLAARLVALANSYDNILSLMEGFREIARESTALHFETESDPQGQKWVPLTADWLADARKQGSAFPTAILRMTGAGEKAATSEEAYIITENEIFFNPSAVPEYMIYHQFGSVDPAVESGLRKLDEKQQLTPEEARAVAAYGRGRDLPQREWLGLTLDDIGEMEAYANRWFKENLDTVFPPSGGGVLERMGTYSGGTFPIVGYTKRGQPLLRTPSGIRFGRMQ